MPELTRFDLKVDLGYALGMPWVSHVLFWPDPVKLLPVFHLELIAAELHVPSFATPFLSRSVNGTKIEKEISSKLRSCIL